MPRVPAAESTVNFTAAPATQHAPLRRHQCTAPKRSHDAELQHQSRRGARARQPPRPRGARPAQAGFGGACIHAHKLRLWVPAPDPLADNKKRLVCIGQSAVTLEKREGKNSPM